jgi:hypothetical protein
LRSSKHLVRPLLHLRELSPVFNPGLVLVTIVLRKYFWNVTIRNSNTIFMCERNLIVDLFCPMKWVCWQTKTHTHAMFDSSKYIQTISIPCIPFAFTCRMDMKTLSLWKDCRYGFWGKNFLRWKGLLWFAFGYNKNLAAISFYLYRSLSFGITVLNRIPKECTNLHRNKWKFLWLFWWYIFIKYFLSYQYIQIYKYIYIYIYATYRFLIQLSSKGLFVGCLSCVSAMGLMCLVYLWERLAYEELRKNTMTTYIRYIYIYIYDTVIVSGY